MTLSDERIQEIAGKSLIGWSRRPLMETLCDAMRQAVAESHATQYGWLVENGKQGDELRYRTWRNGFTAWTANHDEATRYCRRIDAERAHRDDDDAWRIIEHAWTALPQPPETPK